MVNKIYWLFLVMAIVIHYKSSRESTKGSREWNPALYESVSVSLARKIFHTTKLIRHTGFEKGRGICYSRRATKKQQKRL